MNRAETTRFLGDLLKERLGFRSYWSREVSIDYGTNRVKRVDFIPPELFTRVKSRRVSSSAMRSKAAEKMYIPVMA